MSADPVAEEVEVILEEGRRRQRDAYCARCDDTGLKEFLDWLTKRQWLNNRGR